MPTHEVAGPGTAAFERAFELYAAGCEAHHSIASEDRLSELNTWVPAREQGVIIRTTIDRADRMPDGSWLVIDWKTGVYDHPEDTDRQLDFGTSRFVRSAPAPGGRAGPGDRMESRGRDGGDSAFSRGRTLRRTRDYAARMGQRIQATTDFTATPSRACSFCAWRNVCDDAEPGSLVARLARQPGGRPGPVRATPAGRGPRRRWVVRAMA